MKELIVSPVYNAKGNIVGQEFHGELVRCKDCAFLGHWGMTNFDKVNSGYLCSRTNDDEIELTDYCSKAVRRDDGKTD